tara:strand:+ start:949 stop:1245 length:297 start_codon:yes stop_codon:yes gene_type:complete
MKNINILFTISLFMIIHASCATLNKAQGEIHYNNNISKGQELQDLKKALDNGAINQEEYNLMKEKIINDRYVKDLIEKFNDDEDDEAQNRKASFNIEL